MPVRVKVREYLERLTQEEAQKPSDQRKPVPTPNLIARAAGVPPRTVRSLLEADEHKWLDLELLGTIISLCRGYGHDTQLTDLLEYVED